MTDIRTLQKNDCTQFCMFTNPENMPDHQKDNQGNYFIDRDGQLFRYILNHLRTAKVHLPGSEEEKEALLLEAEHFGCEALKEALKKVIDKD